jgi:hypothetical protein
MALALKLAAPANDSFARNQSQSSPQSQPSVSSSRYLGAETCALCHTEIAEKQKKAAMSKAMEKVGDCQILRSHPELKFQLGKFSYKITSRGDQSIYTVSDGNSELSVPILYCFGQGKSGQTYVFEYRGSMYESRLSYYSGIDGLDITLGYANEAPTTLPEALGRRTSVDETRRCFGCHTTGAITKAAVLLQQQLDHLAPGVSCESCHGPGDRHVAALRAGDLKAAKMKRLGDLDGDDLSQNMCANCHRSVEDVMALPSRGGISNIRFQPYRIFNSRCYSADKRIGCTACHDPHDVTQTSAAYYDAKCLACHRIKDEVKGSANLGVTARKVSEQFAHACPTGKNNCASCHMPKIELPGAHFKFTDHRIRIVREGAPFPN